MEGAVGGAGGQPHGRGDVDAWPSALRRLADSDAPARLAEPDVPVGLAEPVRDGGGGVTDLHFEPATRLLALLDDGQVSSRELVDLHLQRIEALDPRLHALVTVDGDEARRQADERDAARRRGEVRGPLHGLPMTVKDAFATAGLRTTAGLEELAEHVPDQDAAAVARLRAAGAIVVGKTSCPPGVSGQETANPLVGVTRNPWDRSRTTGGSSGGAAAALAVGLTPLELGSDLGGSIRQPAAFCGVYGHYPTHGIVPARGHLPAIPPDDLEAQEDLMAVGPMSRAAEDLALALDVLAGPDELSGRGWRVSLPSSAVDGPADLRVAVWSDDEDAPVDTAVRDAIDAAGDALADAGARVDRRARPPWRLREAERVGFDLWVAASSASLSNEQFEQQRRRAEHADADDPGRLARRARAAAMPHRDWLHLDADRRRLQRGWERLFDRVDVVLCPVTPVVAYPADTDTEQVDEFDHRVAQTIEVDGRPRPYLDQLVWTTVVGLARLPSTVVPVGTSPAGLPVGVQVVGRPFADRTTLRVASLLADLTGGFRPPPGF
ncbi:amidase [Egicoccus sp. AB-alg2]|uniref:amidase n=1 Tax=Egicoccus sp. AB-alg2 TaxID=3242693 RepID=UPI00359D08E9